jgi:hypothetical protein
MHCRSLQGSTVLPSHGVDFCACVKENLQDRNVTIAPRRCVKGISRLAGKDIWIRAVSEKKSDIVLVSSPCRGLEGIPMIVIRISCFLPN